MPYMKITQLIFVLATLILSTQAFGFDNDSQNSGFLKNPKKPATNDPGQPQYMSFLAKQVGTAEGPLSFDQELSIYEGLYDDYYTLFYKFFYQNCALQGLQKWWHAKAQGGGNLVVAGTRLMSLIDSGVLKSDSLKKARQLQKDIDTLVKQLNKCFDATQKQSWFGSIF